MKVFKLEVMVIDEDIEDIEQAKSLIEATRFANHTHVTLITAREADIGEWDDDNPLNSWDTQESEMNRLFPAAQNTPSNSDYAKCADEILLSCATMYPHHRLVKLLRRYFA